ncbi:hypothetical protein YC2023_004745 [Brassica napus]
MPGIEIENVENNSSKFLSAESFLLCLSPRTPYILPPRSTLIPSLPILNPTVSPQLVRIVTFSVRSVVSGLLVLLTVECDKIGAAPCEGCLRTFVEGIKRFVVRPRVEILKTCFPREDYEFSSRNLSLCELLYSVFDTMPSDIRDQCAGFRARPRSNHGFRWCDDYFSLRFPYPDMSDVFTQIAKDVEGHASDRAETERNALVHEDFSQKLLNETGFIKPERASRLWLIVEFQFDIARILILPEFLGFPSRVLADANLSGRSRDAKDDQENSPGDEVLATDQGVRGRMVRPWRKEDG